MKQTTMASLLLLAVLATSFCRRQTKPFQKDTDSLSDTAGDGDVDTDTDADMDTDMDTDTDSDTDTDGDSETETDAELLACLDRYSGCTECLGDCVDGFGYELQYPEGSWDPSTDPPVISPSQELQDAAVTYYFCSVCGDCGKDLRVRELNDDGTAGDWKDVTPQEFCRYLIAYDNTCGHCLLTWYGGAGK